LVDAAAALGSSSTTPPPPPPPSTGDILTYAVAFYCANIVCSEFNPDLTGIVAINSSQQQMPYQITNLSDGGYAVGAFQDLDGNQDLSGGEPFGFYDSDKDGFRDDVFLQGQGVGGIDMQLKPFSTSAAGALTPSMKSSLKTAMKQFSQKSSVPMLVPDKLERFLDK
jgi:hypothetical protein